MYKLVDRFKRNANKNFKVNNAKSSKAYSRRGKKKTKFFIFFKNRKFFQSQLIKVKKLNKIDCFCLGKNKSFKFKTIVFNYIFIHETFILV